MDAEVYKYQSKGSAVFLTYLFILPILNLESIMFFLQTLVILSFPRLWELLILFLPNLLYSLVYLEEECCIYIYSRSLEVIVKVSLMLHEILLLGRYKNKLVAGNPRKVALIGGRWSFRLAKTNTPIGASLYNFFFPWSASSIKWHFYHMCHQDLVGKFACESISHSIIREHISISS